MNETEKDLDRVITWQYDNAPMLCGFIDMLKAFYNSSTEDLISNVSKRLNLPDATTCDSFGLTIWGNILSTSWPIKDNQNIEIELYRKILLAKIRFLSKMPTLDNYLEYFNSIFSVGTIKITDLNDMAITFSAVGTLTGNDAILFNYAMDAIKVYPAGIESSVHSTDLMFGLANVNSKQSGQEFGGLDESNLNYRITTEGI